MSLMISKPNNFPAVNLLLMNQITFDRANREIRFNICLWLGFNVPLWCVFARALVPPTSCELRKKAIATVATAMNSIACLRCRCSCLPAVAFKYRTICFLLLNMIFHYENKGLFFNLPVVVTALCCYTCKRQKKNILLVSCFTYSVQFSSFFSWSFLVCLPLCSVAIFAPKRKEEKKYGNKNSTR